MQGKHTVNALAISLLLRVEDGVFVFRQHLRLSRHLRLPPLQLLQSLSLLGQSRADSCNYIVDGPKALSLSVLLGLGESPGDLPVRGD